MAWLVLTGQVAAENSTRQGAFPWQNGNHDQMRILWQQTGDRQWRIALHFRLDEGWKTYWRLAGDSGIDPVIDLTGSSPHKKPVISWPRPQAFDEGDGYWSFGYKDDVILPFDLQFTGPGQNLRLKIDYGVCETICLPEQKDISLTLPGPEKSVARYFRTAAAALPAAPTESRNIERRGNQLTLPRRESDGDHAILEIGGSALIAKADGNQWRASLPPGKRKGGTTARLWLITANDYHVRQFLVPD